MTRPLFTHEQPYRPRRRRPYPVPPGLRLDIVQTPRSLVIDTDRAPDLLSAAGVSRFMRATDGSARYLVPRRDLLRILRAAERQHREVTVRDAS